MNFDRLYMCRFNIKNMYSNIKKLYKVVLFHMGYIIQILIYPPKPVE